MDKSGTNWQLSMVVLVYHTSSVTHTIGSPHRTLPGGDITNDHTMVMGLDRDIMISYDIISIRLIKGHNLFRQSAFWSLHVLTT